MPGAVEGQVAAACLATCFSRTSRRGGEHGGGGPAEAEALPRRIAATDQPRSSRSSPGRCRPSSTGGLPRAGRPRRKPLPRGAPVTRRWRLDGSGGDGNRQRGMPLARKSDQKTAELRDALPTKGAPRSQGALRCGGHGVTVNQRNSAGKPDKFSTLTESRRPGTWHFVAIKSGLDGILPGQRADFGASPTRPTETEIDDSLHPIQPLSGRNTVRFGQKVRLADWLAQPAASQPLLTAASGPVLAPSRPRISGVPRAAKAGIPARGGCGLSPGCLSTPSTRAAIQFLLAFPKCIQRGFLSDYLLGRADLRALANLLC